MQLYKKGDIETITIPLVNKSIQTATNVVVTITLSDGLAYSTATPSSGTVNVLSAKDITWTIPAVTASQSLELQLSVSITSTCNDQYSINWEVTSDQIDVVTANNSECYEFSGLACCSILQCVDVQKDKFSGLSSGNEVLLSKIPHAILIVTRNGLETMDYTLNNNNIVFTNNFNEQGELVIVTYLSQK